MDMSVLLVNFESDLAKSVACYFPHLQLFCPSVNGYNNGCQCGLSAPQTCEVLLGIFRPLMLLFSSQNNPLKLYI